MEALHVSGRSVQVFIWHWNFEQHLTQRRYSAGPLSIVAVAHNCWVVLGIVVEDLGTDAIFSVLQGLAVLRYYAGAVHRARAS